VRSQFEDGELSRIEDALQVVKEEIIREEEEDSESESDNKRAPKSLSKK